MFWPRDCNTVAVIATPEANAMACPVPTDRPTSVWSPIPSIWKHTTLLLVTVFLFWAESCNHGVTQRWCSLPPRGIFLDVLWVSLRYISHLCSTLATEFTFHKDMVSVQSLYILFILIIPELLSCPIYHCSLLLTNNYIHYPKLRALLLLVSLWMGIALTHELNCVSTDLEFAGSNFMTPSLLCSVLLTVFMLTFNNLCSWAFCIAVTILAR
jgi:hypothetical protein